MFPGCRTSLLGVLFLGCRLLNRGGSASKPEEAPLKRILKNWKCFKTDVLKREKLKLDCNIARPLYKLGNGEKWPENRSLNYNTILQLDLYCHKMGKWTEVPYVQAFMVLYQNPVLCGSCNQKPEESENTPDVLDDPLLTFPSSQEGNQAPPTSLELPTSPGPSDQSQTLPPYVPLCPLLPQEGETSPSRVTCSGTSCHLGSGSKLASISAPQGLYPLWEVADGNGGITRVHVPFSMGDLGICKEKSGRFTENPDKFRDKVIRLGLTFSLTWQDIMVILAHCCTLDEKEHILRKAREHTDGLLVTNPHR